MDHLTPAPATPPGSFTGTTQATLQSQPVQQVVPATDSDPTTRADSRQDQVNLSTTGRELSRQQSQAGQTTEDKPQGESTNQGRADTGNLSQEDQQAIQELKQRDREVRAHEAAHLATAGQYASGGPSYTYQQGPDGRRYAVGGEVPINVGKERTPEETIQKMQIVRRAAMAPANPSGADRQIAAQASQKEAAARQELQNERAEQGAPSTSRGQEERAAGGDPGSAAADTVDRQPPAPGRIDLAA